MATGRTTTTVSPPPTDEDLAIETLTSDLVTLLEVVFPDPAAAPTLLVRLPRPRILLRNPIDAVGWTQSWRFRHRPCMSDPPGAQVQNNRRGRARYRRRCVSSHCRIDKSHMYIAEFTLQALPLMHSLLDARPEGFGSPEDAIEWQ